MSLPEVFERTRRPLGLAAALAAAAESLDAGLATLPGQGVTLTFNMETQEQSQWCWAAVAVSVTMFYDTSDTVTQCRVANMVLNTNGCCSNPDPCNEDNFLEDALAQVNHFRAPLVFEPLPFSDVEGEINDGRPLGCRIGWFGGGGHFVIIHGVSVDQTSSAVNRWVAVADPLFGPSDYLINNFTSGYRQGEGEWTHSYFTQ